MCVYLCVRAYEKATRYTSATSTIKQSVVWRAGCDTLQSAPEGFLEDAVGVGVCVGGVQPLNNVMNLNPCANRLRLLSVFQGLIVLYF